MYLILAFCNGNFDFLSPKMDFYNKIQLQKLQKIEIETKHFASFICFSWNFTYLERVVFPFQLGLKTQSFLETEDLVLTCAICHQLCS